MPRSNQNRVVREKLTSDVLHRFRSRFEVVTTSAGVYETELCRLQLNNESSSSSFTHSLSPSSSAWQSEGFVNPALCWRRRDGEDLRSWVQIPSRALIVIFSSTAC